MANLVGDIAISVGADIGPLVRDLGKASGAVSKFGKDAQASGGGMAFASKAGVALGGAVLAAGAAMASFTKDALNNIDALSKQARVAGVSVSTFQAMALVAEEAGVSSEALSKSLVKMQDNITSLGNGGKSQVAVFDQLGISFAQVGKLSADAQFELIAERISGISDPTLRTSAALDVFGKSGADALNMMTGYGAAIQSATDFQEQFGLAVSDTDAANIEAANDALGRAGMAISSLGTQLAVTFAPGIEMVALGLQGLVQDVLGVESALDSVFGSGEIAKAILGEDIYNQLNKDAEAFNNVATQVGELQGVLRVTTDVAGEAASQFDLLAGRLFMMGDSDLATKFYDLAEGVRQATSDFDKGYISIDQYQTIIQAARDRATELLIEAQKIDGVDLSGVRGQVAALGKLFEIAAGKALSLRAAMGSGGLAGAGASASASANIKIGNAPETSGRPKRAPNGIGGIDWGAPVDTGGGGGGGSGGGGGGDSAADDLKRLQEKFASESEVIQAQYAESLAQLAAFRDQKLLTEQEYNELEAKVKEDHEKRLSDIESKTRNERLSAISGAFSDLASLTQSGNDKLFKIGQAAAIAESIVKGYQAAVDAWQKGMKIGGPGMAAAFTAASLAKTGALISSIASQGSRGGGSSGGGNSGGGSTPAPAQPNIANVTWIGEPSKAGFSSLTEKLNAEFKQGYTLNLNFA